MQQHWRTTTAILLALCGACGLPDRVSANGEKGELHFAAPADLIASPSSVEFRVSRRVTTTSHCGTFEIDCESETVTKPLPPGAQVTIVPAELARVGNATVNSSGVLVVALDMLGRGAGRIVVSVGGFDDAYAFEAATPAMMQLQTRQGPWESPALLLADSEISITAPLVDDQGRGLFTKDAPELGLSGPASLTRESLFDFRWTLYTEGVGSGALALSHLPTGISSSAPFQIVPDDIVQSGVIKRSGREGWATTQRFDCTPLGSGTFVFDLRDADDHRLLGGATRFVSSAPEVVSVQPATANDCMFQIASEDTITADCRPEDAVAIRCHAPGVATVSAVFGGVSLSVQVDAR